MTSGKFSWKKVGAHFIVAKTTLRYLLELDLVGSRNLALELVVKLDFLREGYVFWSVVALRGKKLR